jgi:NAD(P)H-hydrate epimerase
MDLPRLAVYSAAAVRTAEAGARAELGLDSAALMQRAGEQAFAALRARWPHARRLALLCGPGNNGGDGYVLARLARAAGCEVTLIAPTGAPGSGAAAQAARDWRAAGGALESLRTSALTDAQLIVDALFGTGLSRPLEPPWLAAIGAINASARAVCALDLPSGLHADTGAVLGAAVRADLTVSFLALKAGLYLDAGPAHAGDVVCADLGLPERLLSGSAPLMRLLDASDLAIALPRRERSAHKGAHGRVLIVGGGPAMPGAVRLAGEAALRAGAGLVTIAAHPASAAAIAAGCPELICHSLARAEDLVTLLGAADLVAIGPGLGQSEWALSVWRATLALERPLVLDADALNLLAQAPRTFATACLTPHPGEAARLLEGEYGTAARVQADRLGALRALRARYGGVIVLKGAASLVACDATAPAVCDRGNPGMAVAGMGDVLTGIIAGIAAERIGRGDPPRVALERAARAGVLGHALAGDRAAARGERGLLPSDLFLELRSCLNPGR